MGRFRMLFILALLLFPCALVGAFVTADEHDLTAFQTGGFFSLHPWTDSLHGRSDAVAKDAIPARRAGPSCPVVAKRKDMAPAAVTVSLTSIQQLQYS